MKITKYIRERIERGFDLLIEKGEKEFFFFREGECWNCDVIINGEIEETNFFDTDKEVLDEIKNI